MKNEEKGRIDVSEEDTDGVGLLLYLLAVT